VQVGCLSAPVSGGRVGWRLWHLTLKHHSSVIHSPPFIPVGTFSPHSQSSLPYISSCKSLTSLLNSCNTAFASPKMASVSLRTDPTPFRRCVQGGSVADHRFSSTSDFYRSFRTPVDSANRLVFCDTYRYIPIFSSPSNSIVYMISTQSLLMSPNLSHRAGRSCCRNRSDCVHA